MFPNFRFQIIKVNIIENVNKYFLVHNFIQPTKDLSHRPVKDEQHTTLLCASAGSQ